MANNKLVLGVIGCAFFGAFAGLTCMGLGGLGWYLHAKTAAPDVAAMVEAPPTGHVDLLTDAAFLDVSAGPFAVPVALAGAPEALPPVEPVEPKLVARPATKPRAATTVPETIEPPPPAAEDDDAPIISDEDVKALDAEVQQIEQEKAAEATETKKKKKNR